MPLLTLSHPVCTLDEQFELQKGTVLSSEKLKEVVSAGKKVSYPDYSILDYGTIREDLRSIFDTPPFDVIFSPEERKEEILKLMENVRLVLPVLQSLDYFREKDFSTYSHNLGVFALTALMASKLIPNYKKIMRETVAGSIHDLGKACVPLQILKKNRPLTQTEFNFLKHHTVAGYVLLTYYLADSRNISTRMARDHHERCNGSGYPKGIRLSDTMVEIVAICDVYHALVSNRPYRPVSFENRTAIEELTRMAERNEIGWDILKVLVSLNRRNMPSYHEVHISTDKRGAPPTGNLYGVIAEEDEEPEDPVNQ